jgi:hypothetical protein
MDDHPDSLSYLHLKKRVRFFPKQAVGIRNQLAAFPAYAVLNNAQTPDQQARNLMVEVSTRHDTAFPPKSTKPTKKQRPASPPVLTYYVFLQYAVLAACTMLLLFFHEVFQLNHKIVSGLLIVASLVNFSVLFERRRIGLLLEALRLVFFALFVSYVFHESTVSHTVLFVSCGLAFFFLVWLMTMAKIFKH